MLFTLVFHTYFKSKAEILVFRNIFIKNGFSGSTLSMQNAKIRCCVQTTDKKGLSFSEILDKWSLQVVTAKFAMSDDLEWSILKAKMYKFWS